MLLPKLRSIYWGKLSEEWKKVKKALMDRVREFQHPAYDPQGPGRVLGPWKAWEMDTTKLSLEGWLLYEDEDDDIPEHWWNDICAAEETWDGYISA